jgi:predicted Zn-dependent protease
MRQAFIALGFFLIAVLVASFLIHPGQKELALMQLEDRSLKQALDKYEALRRAGDNSIDVLAPLVQAYEEEGEIKKAIGILEIIAAKHPHSFEPLQRLGTLYLSGQMPAHYLRNLEQRKDIRPSAALLRELADRYGFAGNHESQMQTLAKLIQMDDYRPIEEDYYKVAMYHAIQGKLDEANEILQSFMRKRDYQVSGELVSLALDTLMRMNKPSDAWHVAKAYLGKKEDEDSTLRFSAFFRERGQAEISLTLLEKFTKTTGPDDDWLSEWVTVKSALNQMDDVYPALSKRHAAGTLPSSLRETLIDLALKRKDFDLIAHLIAQTDAADMTTDMLMQLAGASLMFDKPQLAEKIHRAVNPDFLAEHPLQAGLLKFAATREPKELEAIAKMDPADFSDDYKIMLIEIFDRHKYPAQALALIKTLPLPRMLDSYDAHYIAELYAGQNRPTEGLQVFEEARTALQGNQRAKAETIRGLLLIAAGNTTVFDRWLKENSPSPAMLEAATYIAEKYKQPALQARLAAIVFQRQPTQKNRLLLINALIDNENYTQAMDHLDRLSLDDKKIRQLYLDALAGIAKKEGIGATQKYAARIKTLLTRVMSESSTTAQDKREFAYAMDAAGFKSIATDILFGLAQRSPANSPDVQAVVYFWKENPPAQVTQWLKSRATHSTGEEQALWLTYLADIKRKDLVMQSVTNPSTLSEKGTEIYMDAMMSTQSREALANYLRTELSKSQPMHRLKKLTEIAEWQNLGSLSENGWRRILDSSPNDPQALKELAEITFNRGNYSESEILLQRYLEQNKGDARIHYMYGELMWRKKHGSEANQHFDEAQAGLSLKSKDNFNDRIMEARILYRKNNVEAAIQIFRELLSERPGNKALRADFASMLMEAKRYDEAKSILEQQDN